jgi:hypothetical protein
MSISINYYLFASFWRLLKITLPCSPDWKDLCSLML